MRRQSERKPMPRLSKDREAERKRKYRRRLDVEVLEARVPVSEQIGTLLAMSLLSNASAAMTRVVAQPAAAPIQPLRGAAEIYGDRGSALGLSLMGVAGQGQLHPMASSLSPAGPERVPEQPRISDNTGLQQKPFQDLGEELGGLALAVPRSLRGTAGSVGSATTENGAAGAGGGGSSASALSAATPAPAVAGNFGGAGTGAAAAGWPARPY